MAVKIIEGDCRERLQEIEADTVHCCVSSPPYFGLRDYGIDGQIGLEQTPEEFISGLVGVFSEVRRVLREDGTLWLNLGDSYWTAKGASCGVDPKQKARRGFARPQDRPAPMGIKGKDLIGIPWMAAFALRADGWFLRSHIVWHKPNPMPESVADRPTSAHESLFLLAKSSRYYYDADAIREAESVPDWDDGSRVFGGANKHGANVKHGARTTGRVAEKRKRGVPPRHSQYESSDQSGLDKVPRGAGRNKRNVWTVATRPFAEAHFATFPPGLIEPCILAGCPKGGTVLDPFGGAGTTGLVADRLGRDALLIELNPEYAAMARRRISGDAPLLADVS